VTALEGLFDDVNTWPGGDEYADIEDFKIECYRRAGVAGQGGSIGPVTLMFAYIVKD
jgi:hypothetical protein